MASRPIIVQAGLIAKSANHDATDRQFAPSWMVRCGRPKRHEQKMLAHLGSGVHVETWDDPSWERRIRSSYSWNNPPVSFTKAPDHKPQTTRDGWSRA